MAANCDTIVTSEIMENYKNTSAQENQEIYCICRSANIDTFMISCDFCEEWYHGDCIGLKEENANDIDLFCCRQCSNDHPNLRTTFKSKRRKRKSTKTGRQKTAKKRNPTWKHSDSMTKSVTHNSNILSKKNIKECVDNDERNNTLLTLDIDAIASKSNMDDEELAQIFQMDTTHRKAKTIACENIKQQHNDSFKTTTPKKTPKKDSCLRQCYGPSCVNAARKESKYCSDECGMRLGTNRILEILPQRLQQRKIIPCAADEMSRRKLTTVRRRQNLLHMELVQLDNKIMQLSQMVHKSKISTQDSVMSDDFEDDNSTMDCKLCGVEVPTRVMVKHLESCYKKQERRVLLTGTTLKPDDLEWNIFCNQRISRQGYCKQLRVLCPLHYKESRNEEGVCGYPLQMDLSTCTGKFCGRLKRHCHKHPNGWEDIFRAELDMEKLQVLLKLSDLESEVLELRREMAARGNLMGLMLHQTIVH